MNKARPTRQRPLDEPKVVDAAEFSKRHKIKPGQKLFATLITNQGTMIGELFWEKVPNTVANFVELAEGTRGFIDPKLDPTLPIEKRVVKRPYYDGLIFHRVIPGFMIQGGDIAGTGAGGPGYTFGDEFVKGLTHDGPGIFSMANAGPGTNGSQFFITEKSTPHLNNRHSVFGKLIEGIEVQNKIARVEADNSRPLEPVVIQKVLIGRGKPKRP
ncbi:MAG: peptidylprolyl isomerase [Myxococcales bacterium]|nr:peptidylprolyl isomerase [Myxococcales bacterium]